MDEKPLSLVRTLYVAPDSKELRNPDSQVSLLVFPGTCNRGSEYQYFRELLRESGVQRFFLNKVYEGIFTLDGTISPVSNIFSKMILGTTPVYNKLLEAQMYQEFARYLVIPGVPQKRGTRYDLLLPRDSEWSTFNVLTFGFGTKRTLSECLDLLRDMKRVAKEYGCRMGWRSLHLYFHCHPLNSIPFLHLHLREEASQNCNDLPLEEVERILEMESS